MNFIGVKPKKIVFFPDALFEKKYIGELWGKHFAKSKVFNVFSDEESKQYATIRLGEIFATKPNEIQSNTLIGWWDAEKLLFQFNGEEYAFQKYNLFQNIFSRNTGILESDMLHNKCAFSIQSAVSNCTLNEELELYFAPVKDSRTGRYSMDIMKDALYSGRYGVQIFLEMYYHFYGFEQRKKALENRVLKMANDFYLNTNEMKWFNLSFTNGVASLLMELRNFALISNRNSFVEMIFKIIKSIPEKNITRSEESDYYNGIAGLLYIICDCYKKFNVDIDLYARNLIEYIVTDLFKRCDICGLWFQEEFYHQPLTGLAHGQSGYALALSKALPYINEGMRLKVTSQIQKCMDYEYNCYDNSEMNLPDYRKLLLKKGGDKSQKKFMYGYCSGILGTALVVSELSEELISFQKKEIWKMNAVQYLKKDILIGNDSLCCGTAGWIDYLASCHKNEEWSDELFKKIIFSINEQGYVFNGLEGVNEISLFKGMSGIGYSVLRYMGKYPSVLL